MNEFSSPATSISKRAGVAGPAVLGVLAIGAIVVGAITAIAVHTPEPSASASAENAVEQTEIQFGARIPSWDENEYIGVVVSVMAASTDGSRIDGQNLIVAWGTYERLLAELDVAREDDRSGLAIVVTAGPDAAKWGIVPGSEVVIGRWNNAEFAIQQSVMVGDSWFGDAIRVLQLPRE